MISNTKLSGAEFFRKYADIISEAEINEGTAESSIDGKTDAEVKEMIKNLKLSAAGSNLTDHGRQKMNARADRMQKILDKK